MVTISGVGMISMYR